MRAEKRPEDAPATRAGPVFWGGGPRRVFFFFFPSERGSRRPGRTRFSFPLRLSPIFHRHEVSVSVHTSRQSSHRERSSGRRERAGKGGSEESELFFFLSEHVSWRPVQTRFSLLRAPRVRPLRLNHATKMRAKLHAQASSASQWCGFGAKLAEVRPAAPMAGRQRKLCRARARLRLLPLITLRPLLGCAAVRACSRTHAASRPSGK